MTVGFRYYRNALIWAWDLQFLSLYKQNLTKDGVNDDLVQIPKECPNKRTGLTILSLYDQNLMKDSDTKEMSL